MYKSSYKFYLDHLDFILNVLFMQVQLLFELVFNMDNEIRIALQMYFIENIYRSFMMMLESIPLDMPTTTL